MVRNNFLGVERMPTEHGAVKLERVPRADKLNLLRDIIHLLNQMDGVSGTRRLFYETRRQVTKPEIDFSVESTFNDYLAAGDKLGLIMVTNTSAKILDKGKRLIAISRFGESKLGDKEKSLLKSLLLAYEPFRAFLGTGFCNGRAFLNEDELFSYAKCPRREEIIKAYMQTKRQDTDREARTLLGWGSQIGLTEFDEYSEHYYLIREQEVDLDSFLGTLREVYDDVRHPRTRIASVPEVRFRFCCSMNMQRQVFDNYLLQLFETKPLQVQLARGTTSRDEVLKFGIKGKRFYYYYIKLADVNVNEK
jgi:hypothetical protein